MRRMVTGDSDGGDLSRPDALALPQRPAPNGVSGFSTWVSVIQSRHKEGRLGRDKPRRSCEERR